MIIAAQLRQAFQLNDKACKLGWHPRWSVNTSITNTALWYKTFLNNGDIHDFTYRQILDYFPELA